MTAASPPAFGVLLTVAYDGTAFNGWASQRRGRTVEDALRGAIAALDAHASLPRGTSRTDAGVHAEGQLAAFDATLSIPPRGWVLALNQHLPDDVCVRSARAVPCAYNPRFAARAKRYRYRVLLDRVRDPLLRDRAWRVGWSIDVNKLENEARSAVGTHDFSAFRAAADTRIDTVRTMKRVDVEASERILSIVVEGDAFLYNMVRILVGTLIDVGRGKLEEGTIARAFASAGQLRGPLRGRSALGITAPACGLTLEWIDAELPSDAGSPWPR